MPLALKRGQELNMVADNGGYIGEPSFSVGSSILKPNVFRLGLSNDRPSGVRTALFILFGKNGINPNSMGGFINLEGNYLIAIRNGKKNNSYTTTTTTAPGLKKSSRLKTGGISPNQKTKHKYLKFNNTVKNKRIHTSRIDGVNMKYSNHKTTQTKQKKNSKTKRKNI